MKKIKYKGKKIKVSHAESILEAINDLHTFLESDLYSKFRPEDRIPLSENGKKKIVSFYREDFFTNEREFIKYLEAHFKVLRKEIIRLNKRAGKTVKTKRRPTTRRRITR